MSEHPVERPTREGWSGAERLQTTKDASTWRAERGSASGLLKIAHTEEGQAALAREATLLGRVAHPRIPKLLASGPERKWLVREFIEGTTLDAYGSVSLGKTIEIGASLSAILSTLHTGGFVHGDLKPANVVIDVRGRPHLLDFGTACVEMSRAKPGQFRGTLGYAAPEQLQGQAVRPATDVYSLGVLLYRMVVGHLPYPDADPKSLAYLPLATLPEPISLRKPGLPETFEELIMRMLARFPRHRPQCAAQLAEELRASASSPALAPVVGMEQARSALRSLVSVAVRGQGGVVVVYGKKGSGRTTLIQEAIRSGAREGLPVYTDNASIQRKLSGTLVEEVILYSGEESSPEDVALASRILAERLPCLLLLRSSSPLVVLERRGARHVVPDAISVQEVTEWLGHLDRPTNQAAALQRRCKGLPGKILEALSLQVQKVSELGELEKRILDAVEDEPIAIETLAEQLELSEHATVDLAERLVDFQLVEPAAHGSQIRRVD